MASGSGAALPQLALAKNAAAARGATVAAGMLVLVLLPGWLWRPRQYSNRPVLSYMVAASMVTVYMVAASM